MFKLIFILIIISNSYAQVNIERFRKTEDSQGFSGYVQLNISSKIGNIEYTKINLKNHNDYIWSAMHTFLIVRGDFWWKKKEQYSNEALVHLRHVFRLGANIQPEIFFQIDYNKKRLLTFRDLVGGGLRFAMYKSQQANISLGTAFMTEYERLDLDGKNTHEEKVNVIRWSNYIATNIDLNDSIQWSWTTYIQPCIKEFGDYRILSEIDFVDKLSKHLSLTVAFRMRYDSKPPNNIKLFDGALDTGLAINF